MVITMYYLMDLTEMKKPIKAALTIAMGLSFSFCKLTPKDIGKNECEEV